DVTPFTLGTVVLQIRTLGSELAYGDVQLSYSDGAGTQVLEPVVRGELDRGNALGASVSYLWQWDLRGRDVTDYTLSFGTPEIGRHAVHPRNSRTADPHAGQRTGLW